MTQGIIWKGQPSQFLNFGVFTSIIFVVTVPLIFIRWLTLKATYYEITNSRVCVQMNFIDKKKNCIDISNIKNITIETPLFLKMFNLSNVIITSVNDKKIVFAGVRGAKKIIDKISKQ